MSAPTVTAPAGYDDYQTGVTVTDGAITGTILYNSGSNIYLSFSSDDWTQYTEASVTVGSTSAPLTADTTLAFDVSDAPATMSVTATDGTETVTDTYDLSGLVIEPAPAPTLACPTLTIPEGTDPAGTGTAADYQAHVQCESNVIFGEILWNEGNFLAVTITSDDWTQYTSVTVDVAGDTESITADGTYLFDVTDGPVALVITATDGAETVTETYDISALVRDPRPEPSLTAPAGNRVIDGQTVATYQTGVTVDDAQATITGTVHPITDVDTAYFLCVQGVNSGDWPTLTVTVGQTTQTLDPSADLCAKFEVTAEDTSVTLTYLDEEETGHTKTYTLSLTFDPGQ